jgi:hypothetical protein
VGRFLQAEGVSQSEIRHRLLNVYDQNAFLWEEVSVWYNKFKDGQTALNCNSEKHRGRPKTVHTDEYCVIIESLIREDQRVEVCEIAEVTGIVKSTIYEIMSNFNFRKVSAFWVSKMPTEEPKSKEWLLCLKIFAVAKMKENHFWKASLTGNETCVSEFTPRSKTNSTTLKHDHSPTTTNSKLSHPQKKKTNKQTEKKKRKKGTMATMCWDCQGLLLCEFLPPNSIINSDNYCKAVKTKDTRIINCWNDASA